MTPTDLADTVANLAAGQTVTATVHPYGRGCYTLTGTLRDDAGALRLGGWEAVRLADGTAPVYLRGVELHDAVTEPVEPSWTVDEPTLLHDIPEQVYHSGGVQTPGPQVSQSGLKMLRPPSTPREFQHYLLNGMTPTEAMEFGSAVHTMVLGRGDQYVTYPDDLKLSVDGKATTTEAKRWVAEQREAGRIVLNRARFDSMAAVAEAILHHPVAGELFTDPTGKAEVSAYHEAIPGLWMRSRFDLLRGSLVDLKTAADPHPEAWARQAWSLGYHIQDVAYRRAFVAVTGEPDPGPMMFIIVGSKAPHLISVVTLDAEFERLGAEQLDAALALYSEQRAKHGDPRDPNVRWDGLPSQLAVLAPPRHAFYGAEGVEYEPEF